MSLVSNEAPAEVTRLQQVLRIIARLYRALECTDSSLTLPQYRVLSAVAAGGQRSAKIAEKLAVRKPTLTVAADGLVAAGYLQRGSDPDDRRVVRLTITDAGRHALAVAEAALAAGFSALLDDVSDPDRLIELLLELDTGLDRCGRENPRRHNPDSAPDRAKEHK